MTSPKVYLKQNVLVEPLINQWYAWLGLIPPATANVRGQFTFEDHAIVCRFYAMGQEPWLTYLTSIQYTPQSRPIVDSDKLVADCAGRGITAKRLFGHEEIFL